MKPPDLPPEALQYAADLSEAVLRIAAALERIVAVLENEAIAKGDKP